MNMQNRNSENDPIIKGKKENKNTRQCSMNFNTGKKMEVKSSSPKIQMFLPALCGLTAAGLTLGCPECPRVTASFAVPICICCPVTSNALSIYPNLSLAHATHIQSQWFIPTGSLEVSL
jgi:hypothetical protein